MAVGEVIDLALGYEKDESGDGGASFGLADSGKYNFPNTISSPKPNKNKIQDQVISSLL